MPFTLRIEVTHRYHIFFFLYGISCILIYFISSHKIIWKQIDAFVFKIIYNPVKKSNNKISTHYLTWNWCMIYHVISKLESTNLFKQHNKYQTDTCFFRLHLEKYVERIHFSQTINLFEYNNLHGNFFKIYGPH